MKTLKNTVENMPLVHAPLIGEKNQDNIVIQAISAIQRGDNKDAASIFEQLWEIEKVIAQPDYAESLSNILSGLDGDWGHSRSTFIKVAFCSADGDVLFLGPYLDRRQGSATVELTAIFGREVISHKIYDDLYSKVCADPGFNIRRSYYAPSDQRSIPTLLVTYDPKATAGLAAGDSGETFLPPSFWDFWTPADYGPALLNVPLVETRLGALGRQNIRTIFENNSAELLMAVLDDAVKAKIIISDEYFFHEIGHLYGLPIQEKVRNGMMKGVWAASVEEWRGDGIAFDAQRYSTFGQGMGIAFNLLLRFGMDAHRPRLFSEVDTNASLLTFDRLLNSGAIYVTDGGKLSFAEASYDFLVEAVKPIIEEARQISNREIEVHSEIQEFELRHLGTGDFERALQTIQEYRRTNYKACYSNVVVNANSKELFIEKIVMPCKDQIPNWLR